MEGKENLRNFAVQKQPQEVAQTRFVSSAGLERYLHTVEVTGSNPVRNTEGSHTQNPLFVSRLIEVHKFYPY